jgi:ABC-type dipeptide/oligopeptide/nickel transport system permease subunit
MSDTEILTPPVAAVAPTAVEPKRGHTFLRELARSGTGLFGAVVLLALALTAILAPWISPHDPAAQSLSARLKPPIFFGGTSENILGTDQLGRDLLSRLLQGSRVTLLVALSVVLLAGGFGVVMGLLAGYFGKYTDSIIMRFADMQLAFPGILLALVILYALGPSAVLLVVVLAINGWMVYARIVRSLVLSIRQTEYIEAAELSGSSALRIMFRHILPNLASPVLTLLVLEFARIILAEASLSFLGYGVQPPGSSWGLIIGQGQDYLSSAWWLVTIPGLLICITVLSANLLASWLRIYTDPRQREKAMGRQLDRLVEEAKK